MTDGLEASQQAPGAWLLAFQRVAERTLTLSVTRRCPLRCAHCITNSSRAPELALLSTDIADRWACELSALAADGLCHLTFTGGEPTLASGVVAALARAARAAGIATAVVSSGAFATTTAAADRMVAKLEAVDRWDLGYDEFHAEQLPFEVFASAAGAVARAGKEFCVRVCEGRDAAATDALVERVRTVVPKSTAVIRQPVRALGRGSLLRLDTVPERRMPRLPCISSGLQLQDDGTAAPCCAGFSHASPDRHPFRLGDASAGLSAAWEAWHDDQLLRTVRVLGFAPVLAWLAEDGYDMTRIRPVEDVCEFCVSVWSDPDARAIARRRADDPTWRPRLDRVEETLLQVGGF